MLIEHFKQTPMALAPEEIARATNEYTGHTAKVNYRRERPSVYHFHNRIYPTWNTDIPAVMMYHSEPGPRVDINFKGIKMVPAQYHCLLQEYSDCRVVRNIIPIDDPLYQPAYPDLDIVKVGFSPSHTRPDQGIPFDKGYHRTVEILERVKKCYPDNFDYDVIINQPIQTCIKRKNACNVVIDEVVTDSYHKCTLEGLALGKVVICKMSAPIFRLLDSFSDWFPAILNESIDTLEDCLHYLVTQNNPKRIKSNGKDNRKWMECFWHPRDLIQEYISIYEEALNG